MKSMAMLNVSLGVMMGASAAGQQHRGPSAAEALERLQIGNQRFVDGRWTRPNTTPSRRGDTAENGQHPFAAILSCADSRVPVEYIFDQGIGDLFVMRVAGNVADTTEIASSEYAAGHLHVPLLVVLGHTKCGAVTAAVEQADARGQVPALLRLIAPSVLRARTEHPQAEGAELLNAAIHANIWSSIEHLLRRSEELRELVRTERLQVIGAVYDLHSGEVEWLGAHPRQAQLVAQVAAEHAHAAPAHTPADQGHPAEPAGTDARAAMKEKAPESNEKRH